jgi:hypothetical protein
MGKQTKGVDAFKKYVNSAKGNKKPNEHDKAFEKIKGQSDPINGIKVKTVNF